MMAVADVYDALVSERPYKKPMSHETASAIIKEGRGSHFDPNVTDAFLTLHLEFQKTAEQFKDHFNEALPSPTPGVTA
jgi:putative two-component system response regulator